MPSFKVPDMTCGHCVRTLTDALKGVDPGAEVRIDLGRQLVSVESTAADARQLSDAIVAAGYTPEPASAAAVAPAARTGGCCGCR